MFNPNSNSQMMKSVASDLGFLGMTVADMIERPEWCQFTIGNESITFATLTFIDGRCDIRISHASKTTKISYKGSLERLSHDVAAKVVRLGLNRWHSVTNN